MEQAPTQDYIKGFNAGYQMELHEPGLTRSVLDGIKDKQSDYLMGFQDGRGEAMLEKEREMNPNKKTIPKDHRPDIGFDR